KVRTEDGSALPKWTTLYLHSDLAGSPYSSAISAKDGIIKASIRQGTLVIGGELPGYAPTVIGPFETLGSNHLDNLELVFQRGFPVQIQSVDAVSGKPIANARFRCRFWLPSNLRSTTSRNAEAAADATGIATLEHCASLPLNVTLLAPGYELTEKRFEPLKPGQTLTLSARRGLVTSGTVLDKVTGSPISGATILLFYQEGPTTLGNGWDTDDAKLAITDSQGAFTLHQLRSDSLYWLGVTAPGRESLLLGEVHAGQTNLVARLGPTLVVHGRILGDLESLRQSDGKMTVGVEILQSQIQNSRETWNTAINVKVHDNAGYFEFTNRIAGLVKVTAGGRSFDRDIEAPVDDWVIDLNAATEAAKVAAAAVAKREVIFRFKDSTGIPLKGVVSVSIPDSLEEGHLTAHSKDLEIKNGEVRAEMPIGGRTSIEPKQTVGYWFKNYFSSIVVSNGAGPMIVEVPVIPAGAIYATARTASGRIAGELSFSVVQLKRSPLRDENTSLGGSDNYSGSAARKWVSGPLPLGGTYQIVGWSKNAFCKSKPITLTDEKPDAEVELQFPAGQILEGRLLDPAGNPVRNTEVKASFSISEHGFGLTSTYTDLNGAFRFENTTPDVGQYSVEVSSPGCRAEIVKVDFSRLPLTIRLKPGLKLTGQVIEAETGNVIPNAELRAWSHDPSGRIPQQTTRTDTEGRFEFDTLSDATYQIFVEGANYADTRRAQEFIPGKSGPLKLEMKLYPGSRLVPSAALKQTVKQSDLAANTIGTTNRQPLRRFKVDPKIFTNSSNPPDLQSAALKFFFGTRRGSFPRNRKGYFLQRQPRRTSDSRHNSGTGPSGKSSTLSPSPPAGEHKSHDRPDSATRHSPVARFCRTLQFFRRGFLQNWDAARKRDHPGGAVSEIAFRSGTALGRQCL
ncbi:MAG: carboxypeptidase regulatory-like domain-containing protein, partial [Verrucomicrobiota bacterium]